MAFPYEFPILSGVSADLGSFGVREVGISFRSLVLCWLACFSNTRLTPSVYFASCNHFDVSLRLVGSCRLTTPTKTHSPYKFNHCHLSLRCRQHALAKFAKFTQNIMALRYVVSSAWPGNPHMASI